MKVGILGGSFNPVHIGHVRLALEGLEQLGLDRVELVPAGRPPHKSGEGMLPFDLRLELLAAGLPRGEKGGRLTVNDLEGRRPAPSYTYDTLTEYRSALPDAEIHFIIGARDFLALPAWHRGLELIDLASLAVAGRGEEGLEAVGEFMRRHYPEATGNGRAWQLGPNRTVDFFTIPRLDISSTLVRERWLLGRSLTGLVPDATLAAMQGAEGEIEGFWGRRDR